MPFNSSSRMIQLPKYVSEVVAYDKISKLLSPYDVKTKRRETMLHIIFPRRVPANARPFQDIPFLDGRRSMQLTDPFVIVLCMLI